MPLAQGRSYVAIPGPSVVPDRVLAAMHRPAPNIYAGEVIDLTRGIARDLRALARTRGKVAMYIANGHGAWEAAAANLLGPGDVVLVLATGTFGHGWGAVMARLGAEVRVLDFGKRGAVDPARVAEALAADGGHRIKAVACVHTDTSTSVRNDLPAIRAAIDAAGHPALFLVDGVCAFACEPFEMDAWGVDVLVGACQKGLMTPPGLGFVWFGPRAESAQAKSVSHYWDWRPRAEPDEFWHYWDGTAPTHHLYGLRAALDMIAEEGIEAVWARHAALARAIWAAVGCWGRGGVMELNIADQARRSHAVTSIRAEPPQGTALRDWLSANTGVTLGIGLGMAPSGDPAWHGFFRIGHMGHVNAHMVLGVLASVEAGLVALGLPHGKGALEAAAAVVASA